MLINLTDCESLLVDQGDYIYKKVSPSVATIVLRTRYVGRVNRLSQSEAIVVRAVCELVDVSFTRFVNSGLYKLSAQLLNIICVN